MGMDTGKTGCGGVRMGMIFFGESCFFQVMLLLTENIPFVNDLECARLR